MNEGERVHPGDGAGSVRGPAVGPVVVRLGPGLVMIGRDSFLKIQGQ